MTMPTALPFGLRDIKIIPYTDLSATVLDDTMVDLPFVRTLSFSEAEDFTDLRGDDELITSHGSNAWVEWELESGGIALEAWAVISGGEVTVEGVSPNQIKTYRKRVSDAKPWFALVGQSISDSGGDIHAIIYRCRITDSLEGEFGDQEFFLTSGSGKGYSSRRSGETGVLYDFVQHETVADIILPPTMSNEVQQVAITGSPTGGTFPLTHDAQTTAAIAYNAAASAVQSALEALSNIGVGDVACAGGPLPGTPVTVTFQGALGGTDVTLMTTSSAGLTGGTSPAVAVTTTTPGGV